MSDDLIATCKTRVFVKRTGLIGWFSTESPNVPVVEVVDYDDVPEYIRGLLMRGGSPSVGRIDIVESGNQLTRWTREATHVEVMTR